MTRKFREVGLEPNRRHGQNFLVDINLLRILVESANLDVDDVVLEIGTGTGSLTALVAERVASVVTVEIDRHLHQLASEELIDCNNVTMLLQDALKNKNQFDPRVIEAVVDELKKDERRRLKLVANLPYCIATPVVSNLLALDTPPHSMTVTIQKELAERMVGRPGTKAYGHLSIWIQSQCRAEIIRIMPPKVFWPRPKVESAIVHIELDQQRRENIPDRQFFHRFVRAMFFHRRKFLRSVLISATKKDLSKPEVDEILATTGFRGELRAEQLSVDEMFALSEAVRRRLRTKAP
ncbi:MAG: 16S rRNA (adenine(1518)-N(6)/adenine(1519)-N(6))-dimethyltransferase RsmA [Pirellulales bacterium]